jgi:hypothetical protein
MSTTTTTTFTQVPSTTPDRVPSPAVARQSVWKHGVTAAFAAAATTTAIAALATADGISFATTPGGESIPVAGFTQLTLVFSLVGVGLAAVLARKARRPRSSFVRTAVALTVLSVVPDVTFGFDVPSAVTLVSLHTMAAAIVVPTLAGRLARAR